VSAHTVYIIEAATEKDVQAQFHDDLKADVLLDIEDQWTPVRHQLRAKLKAAGIAIESWPQSLHWDWGRKSLGLAFGGDPQDFRVMAIRRQAVWEGAIVTLSKGHWAQLTPGVGQPLIYADYIESAPWNWTVEGIQARRYMAIGAVLLRAAIEQSYTKGWDGRVGLHALPQAAGFYQGQGFQFVRNDPAKQNLPYYEITSAEASKRTGRKGAGKGRARFRYHFGGRPRPSVERVERTDHPRSQGGRVATRQSGATIAREAHRAVPPAASADGGAAGGPGRR
jgi:hypothetical protein